MGWKSFAKSVGLGGLVGPPPIPMPVPPDPALPPAFVRFVEPFGQAYTTEVPQGWKANGGLLHPGLGDLRPWTELRSPDGVYLMATDPEVPQTLQYNPMNFQGTAMPTAGGGMLLNLKPSADTLADYYIKHVVPRRFGQMTITRRGPRPDIVILQQQAIQRIHGLATGSHKCQAVEVQFVVQVPSGQLLGSILVGTCHKPSDLAFGVCFWAGGVSVTLSLPEQIGMADYVRRRTLFAFTPTPNMTAIATQDSNVIFNNAAIQNAAQWSQFNAMQRAHYTQESIGNVITSGYWHNQATLDRISENRSDAMRGHQRLADTSMNQGYYAEPGYDYYFLDQQTGQVTGNMTGQPPDPMRNYTSLEKL